VSAKKSRRARAAGSVPSAGGRPDGQANSAGAGSAAESATPAGAASPVSPATVTAPTSADARGSAGADARVSPTSPTTPTSPVSPAEFVAPTWQHSLLDVEREPVFEPDLKALLKTWRRGRATKRLSQVLQDGYVAIFSVVVIVAMIGGAVFRAQSTAQECVSSTCLTGRTLLPWVMLLAAFALTLVVARLFGPVVASAAEGFWLMDAPIRRARLLRGRLVAVLVAVALGSAVVGATLAALTGYPVDQILEWAAALGLGAAGLTAFAALEQTFGRTWLMRLVQWVVGAAGFAALVVITGVAAGWFRFTLNAALSTRVVVGVALAGVALLVVFGILALGRLGQIHRARLVSGGNLISGMQGAAFAMDLGLMRDILIERDAMAVGQVRPTLGFGRGLMALVGREVQRLWRYPKRLVLFVVSLGVPYAVGALGLTRFNPFICALVLLMAFVPLLGSLRVLTRTRGLARMFPFTNARLRYAVASVAAGLAVVWALLATPAFYGLGAEARSTLATAVSHSLITAAAGLLAGVRWVSAKPADYSTPMMQTGFGALPPGLMFNLFKGLDVAVVVTGPLLLGWSPWVSVAIGTVVVYLLSGSFDMREAQQMQAELKKERERAQMGGGPGRPGGLGGSGRPGGGVQKTVIAPPRR